MKIVYVSGPITGDGSAWTRHCNLHEGIKVARDINALMPGQLGAFSPHGNTYHMDGPGITWDQFMQLDLELIARFDGIVMMPRWRESPGAMREHTGAVDLGKPVFLWPLDRPRLMRWASGEACEPDGTYYGPYGPPHPEDDLYHIPMG